MSVYVPIVYDQSVDILMSHYQFLWEAQTVSATSWVGPRLPGSAVAAMKTLKRICFSYPATVNADAWHLSSRLPGRQGSSLTAGVRPCQLTPNKLRADVSAHPPSPVKVPL